MKNKMFTLNSDEGYEPLYWLKNQPITPLSKLKADFTKIGTHNIYCNPYRQTGWLGIE